MLSWSKTGSLVMNRGCYWLRWVCSGPPSKMRCNMRCDTACEMGCDAASELRCDAAGKMRCEATCEMRCDGICEMRGHMPDEMPEKKCDVIRCCMGDKMRCNATCQMRWEAMLHAMRNNRWYNGDYAYNPKLGGSLPSYGRAGGGC